MSQPILETRDLTKEFRASRGLSGAVVHAVSDLSLRVETGSVTAVVGESGSGKSTLARLLAQLYPPTRGEIRFDGEAVTAHSSRALRKYVGRVQMILQDPYASLNPHKSVGHSVRRAVACHAPAGQSRAESRERVYALLEQVGLRPGRDTYAKYPHELSGGQRQRVSIARALAVEPDVLIADEPVSMLDVSLRLGVLDLLRALNEAGLTIVYITHDLPSARWFAETIAVMYAGRVVEQGPAEAVVDRAAHPYTQLLLSATPDPSRPRRVAAGGRGEPPSLIDLPKGCSFHPRCPHAFDKCREIAPPSFAVGAGQTAACWLHEGSSPSNGKARSSSTSGTTEESQ